MLKIAGKSVKLIDTVTIGDQVSHVAIAGDGKRAVAAKFPGHKAALLAINGDKVTYDKQDIAVGWWPYNLDITPDGKLLLTADNGLSGGSDGNIDTVTVIDLELPPRVIDKVVVGDGPEGFAVSPTARWRWRSSCGSTRPRSVFYNRNGSVVALKIDGKKVTRTNEVEVRGLPEGLAFSDDGNTCTSAISRQRHHDPAGRGRPLVDTGSMALPASGVRARQGALTLLPATFGLWGPARRRPPSVVGTAPRSRTLGFAVLAMVVAGCGPSGERPLQGYVEGEYVRVGAPFAGALTQLSVKRGDLVAAGAPLFALERENEVAARRQAEQQLQAAQARLSNLRTGKRPPEVETVAEQLRQAMATRDLAQSTHAPTEAVRQRLRERRGDRRCADASQAQRSRRRRIAGGRHDGETSGAHRRVRAAEADAQAAREALAQADWRLGQRAIASPVSGRVNDTYYVIGDWVPAGNPSQACPPANVKVRFFVPEPVLGRLKPGQSVNFSCDGCGAPMTATITFISDRAEFTPPVLYSRDNRAKLVFLVEAKPSPEIAARLNPGQPVDVVLPQ